MSVLNLMANEGLGLNKFVSAGNMLDIRTEEFFRILCSRSGKQVYIFVLRRYSRWPEVDGNCPEVG